MSETQEQLDKIESQLTAVLASDNRKTRMKGCIDVQQKLSRLSATVKAEPDLYREQFIRITRRVMEDGFQVELKDANGPA